MYNFTNRGVRYVEGGLDCPSKKNGDGRRWLKVCQNVCLLFKN